MKLAVFVFVFVTAFICSQGVPLGGSLHGQIVHLERQYDHLLRRDADDDNKLDHYMRFQLRNEHDETLGMTLVRNLKLSRNIPLTIANDEGERDTDIDELLADMGHKRSTKGNKTFHERNMFYHEPTRKGIIGLTDDGSRITMRGTFFDNDQLYEVEPLTDHPTHAHVIRRSQIPRQSLHDSFNFDVKRAEDDGPISGYRAKRTTFNIDQFKKPSALNVEVLVATDAEFYRMIKKDLTDNSDTAALEAMYFRLNYIMNGVDLAYAQILKYPFDIWCKRLFIATTDAATPWTAKEIRKEQDENSKHLDCDLAIAKLGQWATETKGWAWNEYDHITAITGYDLGNLESNGSWTVGTIGYAYRGMVCVPNYQTSLTEQLGFNTWSTVAHEMAHNLGAGHDGVEPDDKDPACAADKGFLMTPDVATVTVANMDNVVKFSPCSEKQMTDNCLGTAQSPKPSACLFNAVCFNEASLITWASKPSELPGQKWDADKQCQIQYGKEYYFYRNDTTEWPGMCTKLPCASDNDLNIWFLDFTADGTFCNQAQTKWCIQYRCVDKTDDVPLKGALDHQVTDPDFKCGSSPSIPPDCTDTTTTWFKYYKDSQSASLGTSEDFTLTCPELINKDPFLCANDAIYCQCCKTCRSSYFIVDTSATEGTGETACESSTGAPSTQSSLDWGGEAEKANDGDANPKFHAGSCSHTLRGEEGTTNPWWAVKVCDSDVLIQNVTITNRGDGYGDRLKNFNIGILDEFPSFGDVIDPTSYDKCATKSGSQEDGATVTYTCSAPMPGGTVIVQIVGTGQILSLCEVDVGFDAISNKCQRYTDKK